MEEIVPQDEITQESHEERDVHDRNVDVLIRCAEDGIRDETIGDADDEPEQQIIPQILLAARFDEFADQRHRHIDGDNGVQEPEMDVIPVGQQPVAEVDNELVHTQLASHQIVLIVQAVDERPGQEGMSSGTTRFV